MRPSGVGALVAIAVMLLGAACNTERGSGTLVTRRIDVPSFSRLQVSDSFTVDVSVGDVEEVTVRVDDNLVGLLDIGVSGGTLRIGVESGTDVLDATMEADVTVSSLDELRAAGASSVRLTDPLAGDTFGVSISGSSRLTGAIDIEECTIDLSGSSIADPSGTARGLEARVSGASQLDAPELTVDDLTIDLSGASLANVDATGTLSAGASGASTLRYAGSPVVERSDVSGSSSIEPVG
jgi:hypothetical protein